MDGLFARVDDREIERLFAYNFLHCNPVQAELKRAGRAPKRNCFEFAQPRNNIKNGACARFVAVVLVLAVRASRGYCAD